MQVSGKIQVPYCFSMEKSPFSPFNKMNGEFQNRYTYFAEKSLNILTQLRIEERYLCRTSYSVGTILAEISLLYRL